MNYAKLESSERLQRVFELLKREGPKTTREIIREANVCAVSSIIAELKANGIPIMCKRLDKNIYEYSLINIEKGEKVCSI